MLLKNILLLNKVFLKKSFVFLLSLSVIFTTIYSLTRKALAEEEIYLCEDDTTSIDCYGTKDDKDAITYLNIEIDKLPYASEIKDKIDNSSLEIDSLEASIEDEEVEESTTYDIKDILENASNLYNYYLDQKEKVQNLISNKEKLLEYVNEGLISPKVEEKKNNESVIVEEKEVNTLTEETSFIEPILKSSLKVARNNSSELTIVNTADTKDLIEVNLYDYESNINDPYWGRSGVIVGDRYRPGFQQSGGTTSTLKSTNYKSYSPSNSKYWNVTSGSFNFGDNIVTDLEAYPHEIAYGTYKAPSDSINVVPNGNRPVSYDHQVMNVTLNDEGYPRLSKSTTSNGKNLNYLFGGNNTYSHKKNTDNINGLFQYNEETGKYSYDSRNNHAEFNQDTNTFTVYNQKITPNFMMYPFGNFLPFNHIKTEATKVTDINKDYFQSVLNSATTKSTNNAYSSTYKNAYSTLSNRLTEFISYMNSTYGKASWNASTAATAYFSKASLNKTITNDILNNLYNIDYDEPTNFFFGLDMKMNFMQPKSGLTGKNGNQPMQFFFTGDDDVWVYVDNILFLDLSGIHRHVGGEIDFESGKVYYYELDSSTGDVNRNNPIKTVTFSQILGNAGLSNSEINKILNSKGTLIDYSTHSFNFYYMERGAGSGVMRMEFNMPLLKKNNLSVTKELTNHTSKLGNPDFYFQILKANNNVKTNNLFIGANTAYDIYNESGIKLRSSVTDEFGIFKIKAGEMAVFSGIEENSGKYYVRELIDGNNISQYSSISVDGANTTRNNNLTINDINYVGLESSIKDISDGNTSLVFNNNVDVSKYGSLKLKKEFIGYVSSTTDKTFEFYITIDNIPLQIGTTYQTLDGVKTVESPGIIKIKPDEEIVINNILAGSNFTLKENITEISGYMVSYFKNEEEITEDTVTGIVNALDIISIKAINSELGIELEVPFTKNIANSDDLTHTYEFNIQEINDLETKEVIGSSQKVNLDVLETANGIFRLSYPRSNYKEEETYLYYKITETNLNDNKTKCDDAIYFVEVLITNKVSEFKAEITRVLKNNEEVQDKKIIFINNLLKDLEILKTVKNPNDKSGEFKFEITIIEDDVGINGEYQYQKGNQNGILEFSNGKANISLSNGESIIIKGIRLGATYQVKELTTDGFTVEYKLNDGDLEVGDMVTNQILKENKLEFINISGYELPKTGSSGMLSLIIIGSILLMIPVIYKGYKLITK